MERREKKSRKKRAKERRDDGIPRGCGINYNELKDRHVDDKRFERERQKGSPPADDAPAKPLPSTQDALFRIQAGLESRTIAQKIADPFRPTWEQYKKENEDKLDLKGQEVRKMLQYRQELDAERERKLALRQSKAAPQHVVGSDDDDDELDEDEEEDDDGSNSKKKRRKREKEKEKEKKRKKKSKKKTKRRSRSGSRSEASGSEDDSDFKRRKHDSDGADTATERSLRSLRHVNGNGLTVKPSHYYSHLSHEAADETIT
jgi:hypothetical protein